MIVRVRAGEITPCALRLVRDSARAHPQAGTVESGRIRDVGVDLIAHEGSDAGGARSRGETVTAIGKRRPFGRV